MVITRPSCRMCIFRC